jgi:uncharacterized protein (TIGR01244 family)
MFRQLDPQMLVSGQILPEDVAEAAAQGVTTIVNNRPDNEQPGQPTGAAIEAAAHAVGIAYHHIPIAGGFPPDAVRAMARVLDEAGGRTLAFCRSGTRSAYLWALARSQAGEDAGEIIAKAADAGYDLEPLRPHLAARGA